MIRAAQDREVRYAGSGQPASMDDLFGGLAEWTTTKYDFPGTVSNQRYDARLRSMQVLKGYGDPDKLPGLVPTGNAALLAPPDSNSPMIGFRCVRSGTPRFVTP